MVVGWVGFNQLMQDKKYVFYKENVPITLKQLMQDKKYVFYKKNMSITLKPLIYIHTGSVRHIIILYNFTDVEFCVSEGVTICF